MSKDWEYRLMDKLAGDLSEKEAAQFEHETIQDAQLAEEFTFFSEAWNAMDDIDHNASPEDSLSEKFYTALNAKIEQQEKALPNRMRTFFFNFMNNAPMVRNMALGSLLLAVGFILGGKWNNKNITVNHQTTTVHTTVPTVASNVAQASYVPTTTKIQQINNIPQASSDDRAALQQLIQVLQTENNTNVKLAALRQIDQNYANTRGVKNFLAKQLQQEPSPLVQIELLNILMKNNNSKETIQTMESILNKKQLNPVVQEKIRNDLPVLRASYVK